MLPAGGGYTPIASLPAELLLIILKTIYVDTRQCVRIFDPHILCQGPCDCKLDLNEGTLTEWNDHDDLTSPSVFPYAVASVCKQWYDLTLLVPEFWTRLVIFVDSQPTPISDLRAQLSASRDWRFRAHIINRQDGIGEDCMERARVQAVVEALSPHFHRCERLTFNVMHNSSIPSIRHNFSGCYPLLMHLLMECKIHDSKPQEVSQNEAKAQLCLCNFGLRLRQTRNNMTLPTLLRHPLRNPAHSYSTDPSVMS